jgi:hypothetical protein
LQEGVLPCKVAWQKRKLVRRIGTQENWTMRGVLPCQNKDDLQCESDTVERTRTPETSQRQECTEDSDTTDIQDETPERPGMQNRNKGSSNKTAPSLQIERTTEKFNRKALGVEFLK